MIIIKRIITIIFAVALILMPVGADAAVKKPAKVKFAKCSVTASSVTLKWKKAKNAKKYEVYQLKSKKYKKIRAVKTPKITIKSLKEGTVYKFKIRGVNGKKKGKFSAIMSIRTKEIKKEKDNIKPKSPTMLKRLSFSNSSAEVLEGEEKPLTVKYSPLDAINTSSIKLISNNSKVATAKIISASNGSIRVTIKGSMPGKAMITARAGDISSYVIVTVNAMSVSKKPVASTDSVVNTKNTTQSTEKSIPEVAVSAEKQESYTYVAPPKTNTQSDNENTNNTQSSSASKSEQKPENSITSSENLSEKSSDKEEGNAGGDKSDDEPEDQNSNSNTSSKQSQMETMSREELIKNWTPDKGFEMFTSDFSDDADLSAAFGFGNDACVLASIKYSKGVDKNSPTLDKIRCVAEWMADNLSYCRNPVKNKVTRATACAGYASYYEYLLNTYFGVETISVVAYPETPESDHAWNMVKYNGNWYAVDVTWFDTSYLTGKTRLSGDARYSYQWFMKSSKYFYETHKDSQVGAINAHSYGTPEEIAAYCKANNYMSSYFTVATATDMDDYDWSAYGNSYRTLVSSWGETWD